MKKIILIIVSSLSILAACQKVNLSTGIDIEKFESRLNTDYSNASVSHYTLTGVLSDSHLSHHSGTSPNPSSSQFHIFNTNDSLFSEHFYEFCSEMMKNGRHMTSDGMMNHSGMMGGSMGVNCSSADGDHDMAEVIEYMENIHNSGMMSSDYYKIDSLLYSKMSECRMMNRETEGISAIFNKMQLLRKEHKAIK